MDLYKIYRQYLYKKKKEALPFEEWEKVKKNVTIRFYDHLQNKKGDAYGLECEFTFKNGKVDKKELVSFCIESTKEESEKTQKMWDTEQEIFDTYRERSLKYRFFSRMENCCRKMTNWARNKHSLPLEIRKEAYEKSGRLKKDPKSLDLYKDL